MFRRIVLSVLVAVLLAPPVAAAGVVLPVDGYFERQTLKGFGVLVDDRYHAAHRDLFPNNGFANQYTGYHAGVDVEYHTLADQVRDIPVRAVADGSVIFVGDVSGYGGVVVVRHDRPEPVTTLYGHLRLRDLAVKSGQSVTAGQTIGWLGASFSAETSGARRHLHFAVHKGPGLELRGHAAAVSGLSAWYEPNAWLAKYRTVPSPTVNPSPSVGPDPPVTAPAERRSWYERFWDWLSGLLG